MIDPTVAIGARAMPNLDDLKSELLQSDESYRGLHDQHQACEARLAELLHNTLPSPEDEVEEKRLKIQKLGLKDRMEEILREHRAAMTA
jgi:uncharacterized protein YdcH (DUF465 family)